MKDGPNIARIAGLVGDAARAEILTALMTGQALTATELVGVAGLTKQTVSGHLAKLVDAQLISVEHQGRHRYFRLADPDVAHLLESLMGIAFRTGAVRVRSSPREPALRKARVCYDHLAGDLGVAAMDSLVERRLLRIAVGVPELTRRGREFCAELGIALEPLSRQKRGHCRTSLDRSVRRPPLPGARGAAILSRCFELGWARRATGSRVVQFSAAGERAFRERFAVAESARR